MNKRFITFLIALMFATPQMSFAAATQVDALIEKLVEKGILDKKEALALKMEIAEDAKVIQEDSTKSLMPDWVKNTKLKGDVRVRYQFEKRANDVDGRARGRIRYRLGLENQITPEWKAGAGLASAAVDQNSTTTVDDPRSTNTTFEDSFSRGTIRLDYAFGEYQPAPWGKIIAGKFVKTDYLWTPTDMLWDTDINPAGTSIHLEQKVGERLTGYLNSGLWVIDENGKNAQVDPSMHYVQTGANYKQDNVGLKLAGVYYGFHGVQGAVLAATASTNTLSSSLLKYDYDALGLSAEASLRKPVGELLPIEQVALFGDLVRNVDSIDDRSGWATGVKLGDEKVAGPKQWQVKYQLTTLRKDAWPDAFPDSDRLGGATDIKGHEWELVIGLTKNVSLGFDYYQDQRIKAAKNPQKLVQADLNIKF